MKLLTTKRLMIFKKIFICGVALILSSAEINAQSSCFYDPNNGPFYSNGSPGAIYDVTYGDFNADNHVDIVTANSVGDNISFIPGYGDGTLGTPDTVNLSGTLFCIASADLNGDGQLDVATANNSVVFVLMGNGDGTFQPATSYPAGSAPSRIYCEDINDDNIPDIVEACGNGVFVLLGLGDGAFSSATNYLAGLSSNDVVIADFDNDAILDLVSTTHLTVVDSELSFLKGVGDGTFTLSPPVFSITYPDNSIAGITSTDIDGDGEADLIVANSKNTIKRVEVYLGNGDGTFNSPVYYSTHLSPFYVYHADVNSDSIEDIIVEEGNGFSVLRGNGNGTFGDYEHFSAISTPNSLALGDFNEDGKVDVIIPSAYFGSPLIVVNLNCNVTGLGGPFQDEEKQITIFPNPFHTATTIEFAHSIHDATINIYDVSGRIIKSINHISGHHVSISRDNMSSGAYFIHLLQDNKVIATGKLIVEE